MDEEFKDVLLSTFEASLEAQLRAVRRLRQGETEPKKKRPGKGLSQVDMAYDVLKKTPRPVACLGVAGPHRGGLRPAGGPGKSGLFLDQESGPRRSLPADRQEYLWPAPGGPMTLLAALLEILSEWRQAFPQQRSWKKAARQGIGFLACLGRRTLSRIIWTNGGQQRSWSSEYFLHSRCRWQPERLFEPDPGARVEALSGSTGGGGGG